MFDYVKFLMFSLIVIPVVTLTTLGGHWHWYGMAVVLTVILSDVVLGEDMREPKFAHKGFLNFQLYLSLPLMLCFYFVVVWSAAPGDTDPLGYGAWVQSLTGIDVIASRQATAWYDYIGMFMTVMFYTTTLATLVAHELTHRTWDRLAMFIGRWLLAFIWDVGFATEHVYGHHAYVGTRHDPATAPRGRGVYKQIVIATARTNANAWRLERERLQKLGLPVWSHHNAFLRGQLMSLSLAAGAYLLSGWRGVLFFVLMCAGGKILLEIVNYIEHYGMVRVETEPVQPRHSWNTNCRVSSWATFNLTRHSHHHAEGEVPYWDLRPYAEAPRMVTGYLGAILLAVVPPLWHRVMVPKLLDWDRRYASSDEKRLAGLQNKASGIPALMANSYGC